MPITSSAKKALRQSKKRATENLKRSEAYKLAIKKIKKAILAKDLDAAKALLPEVYQKLDKAAKTNVIAPNKASRLKSRLTQKIRLLNA